MKTLVRSRLKWADHVKRIKATGFCDVIDIQNTVMY